MAQALKDIMMNMDSLDAEKLYGEMLQMKNVRTVKRIHEYKSSGFILTFSSKHLENL